MYKVKQLIMFDLFEILFVLDARISEGSHQTADSVSASRESHPHVVLTRPPSLPATASRRKRLSRSCCDWTGVSLSLLPIIATLVAAQCL